MNLDYYNLRTQNDNLEVKVFENFTQKNVGLIIDVKSYGSLIKREYSKGVVYLHYGRLIRE